MKVKLGNICEIQSGGTPSRAKQEYWNGLIPWIKISDMKTKFINASEEKITEKGLKNSSAKLFDKGTILYSIFASLGVIGILDINATTNQAIAGIKVVDDNFLVEYIYYYLKSKKEYVNLIGRGVAQNNINLSLLKNFEIEEVSLSFQNKITSIMIYIENIINLYESQLKYFDNLVKSRFVEMFGKEKKKIKFAEVAENMTKGPFGSDIKKSLYVPERDDAYKVYIQINCIQKDLSLGDYYISKEYYDTKMKRFKVNAGDYLITCDGTLGKYVRVPKGIRKGIISASLLRLTLNEEKIIPKYFEAMWDNYFLEQLKAQVRNGCLQHLPSASVIGENEIPLPNINEQENFASFVDQVDKSKFVAIKLYVC